MSKSTETGKVKKPSGVSSLSQRVPVSPPVPEKLESKIPPTGLPDAILHEMEQTLQKIEAARPRLAGDKEGGKYRLADLEALLLINRVINSSLILDEILQIVMQKAIELLKAERGFLMLVDERGELQFKTAHNIGKELLTDEDFRISRTIANQVARSGESVYTSDALKDDRYAHQKSVMELHLRSIMCVPLKSRDAILGVLYLDNSSEVNVFLQSDLFLFELFAGQAAFAIEHAKLYDSLLRMERYHEEVVNRTPVGIIVVDSAFTITTANEVAQQILGASGTLSGSLLEKKIDLFTLFPSGEREKWRALCQKVLATGQAHAEPRYYLHAGPDERVLSLKISPLVRPETGTVGLILVFEETTEKVMLENYVIMSEKLVAKGEMAAAIGHELNNYLTIISNCTEMLELTVRKGDQEKLQQNTGVILENIGKMKRFTDGLMDYTRLETEPVPYELPRLVDDLLFAIKPQQQFRKIRFVTEVAPGLPKVAMDVGQVQQVLLNLFNNAAEAMAERNPPGGTITIEVKLLPEKSQVEIVVADDGPGIQPAYLDRIFDPRFTTKKTGHGLGLSTCKRIIENHRGTITVKSAPGVGTQFFIRLPLSQTQT